jgi:hypothetical protein
LTDDEIRQAILAKAEAMYGMKARCKHVCTTLVQHEDEEYGWFMCWQCDECGQITRGEVTAEDLAKTDVPWLDVDMYEHVTTERMEGEKQGRALAFIGKATK